ncbi:hypothetical protein ACFLTJ_00385 [Chloroflexota bacterium]
MADVLHVGKTRVVDIEEWLRIAPLETVQSLFGGYHLRTVVDKKLSDMDVIHVELAQAARLTADDILQHYREDYLPSVKPLMEDTYAYPLPLSGNQIGERHSEHWARLGKVAEALKRGLNFPRYVEGENVESRYGGTVWGNWSFSVFQLANSKFVESPEIRFSAEDNDLWGYLMRHMDAEFPGFVVDFNKFKKVAVGILKTSSGETNREHPKLRDHPKNLKLRQKLWLVIERGTFKGSCDICED